MSTVIIQIRNRQGKSKRDDGFQEWKGHARGFRRNAQPGAVRSLLQGLLKGTKGSLSQGGRPGEKRGEGERARGHDDGC